MANHREAHAARAKQRRRAPEARVGLARWLPWLLIGAGSVGTLVLFGPALAQTLAELLLRTFGLGVVLWPPGLLATAWVVWRRPVWLRKYWRRWLGGGVLALALVITLSFFATREGVLSEVTLGGNLGRALGRNLPQVAAAVAAVLGNIRVLFPSWQIALGVVVLALAGFLLIAPKQTLATLRRIGRGTWSGSNAAADALITSAERVRDRGMRPAPRPPRVRRAPAPVAAGPPPAATPPPPVASMREHALPGGGHRAPAGSGWWKLPPITLLDPGVEVATNDAETERRRKLVEEALASYGIEARVVEVSVGPTVTRFGVEPGWVRKHKEFPERDTLGRLRRDDAGHPVTKSREVSRTRVKVEAIANLHKDLALALAAPSLRIEAPVPGKGYVGLEVPNSTFTAVSLRSVIESPAFVKVATKSKLGLVLGKGVGGEPVACDLATLPHLLIAGATGAGKSVCLKACLICLMMKANPDELKLILVDPKRVELAAFSRLPHLLLPPVVEPDKVSQTLKELIAEMDNRYRKFAAMRVNSIDTYNHAAPDRQLPYIALFVDELADLMMVAPTDVEQGLSRLAQLGRAAGIHLVVATQRPSVDVVTGLIKANFPARISFAVASQVDSRVILDAVGAEKLLGKGDMLFQPTDSPQPKRVQGVFVSEGEIEKVVEHWARQGPPAPHHVEAWPVIHPAPPTPAPPLQRPAAPQPAQRSAPPVGAVVPAPPAQPSASADPLWDAARGLATQVERLSPSLLQRRLRIGRGKALELLDALEAEGIVGPPEAGESRLVKGKAAASANPAAPQPAGTADDRPPFDVP